MTKQTLSPKQIADYIPETLEEIAGNGQLVEYFRSRMSHPPEEDPPLMVTGDPGTGKTSSVLVYVRLRLKDPKVGYSDDSGLFSTVAGKSYGFVRIDGTCVDRKEIQ